MKIICSDNQINFQRRLRTSEEAEFSDVLKQGKTKIGNKGKSILIVPATSLPNHTGVGNLGTKESLEFFDFAKKYWGINEIQILPIGQYHNHNGEYPIYSGTSTELGNHVINIEKYISDSSEIIKNNKNRSRVNFANIVENNSAQENALWKIFEEGKFQKELNDFKKENACRLETKALYRALRKTNGTHDYKQWNEVDKNLFNSDIVSNSVREKRISEIKKQNSKLIDFYYFKQYLAEDSLKNAKEKLNSAGLKLNGDMLCGFSYDEIWANPKAFRKDTTIGWGLPALDLDSPEGERVLREKVDFYAKRFDGIRIDAAWTYASQPNICGNKKEYKHYDDKILNIIEDEVKKVKGSGFDLKNIMYEFDTSPENFRIYENGKLKPFLKDRVKIYTSDYLSEEWGSNKSFLERGWKPESFILSATNHDSARGDITNEQIKVLSKIFKIPQEKLSSQKEALNAKLAETMSSYNNALNFMDALNLKGSFLNNSDKRLNYTTQIPLNYEEEYFHSLANGEGYNPMKALEMNFKAKGLDKKEPKLYKKIVKFRKILEKKEKQSPPLMKIGCGIACFGLLLYGYFRYFKSH